MHELMELRVGDGRRERSEVRQTRFHTTANCNLITWDRSRQLGWFKGAQLYGVRISLPRRQQVRCQVHPDHLPFVLKVALDVQKHEVAARREEARRIS